MADQVAADVEVILATSDLAALSGASVLVTGATGLVGTYLLATLVAAQRTGNGPSRVVGTSRSGLLASDLDLGAGAAVVAGDLTDPSVVAALPGFDLVIHAAGYGQPGKFTANPLATLALNTSATLALVDHVEPGGRMLFVSTSEVYSGLVVPPFAEHMIGTTSTDHPRASYIEGKRAGEAIMFAARESRGIQANSARLALAYGPATRTDDTRVLNEFIRNGLLHGEITLRDAGVAMRTYCYITDAVQMLLDIALRGTLGVYNVGGTSRTSIRDLASSIGALTGASVTIPEVSAGAAGAPDDVWLDLTRTVELSQKRDFVSLDDGLARTVAWQRGLYAAGGPA